MNNLERVRSATAHSDVDALLITGETSRLYATGFHSTAGALFVTGEKAWFLTDSRYTEAAGRAITGANVLPVEGSATYFTLINGIIKSESIKTVGFEDDTMSFREYARFSEKLEVKLMPRSKLVNSLRAVKSPEELSLMIEAQRLAERAFGEILPLISTDLTEKQLAAELMCAFYRCGADDKSFDPIVVSGSRSSMPHGVPTDMRIQKGFLTIDFGVKLGGWCSDTTRTLCIGKPTDEMRRVYDTVLSAQLAGIAAARAGVTGSHIDSAARGVIADAGYGDCFGHSFGHGLGLDVHESPTAGPSGGEPMPAGAVISAEPGIYLPGKFGVRIEDVLFLTPNGSENITNLPKELIIL